MTSLLLRSSFEVVRALDIRPGDVLRAGRVRVNRVAIATGDQILLSLANGRTVHLPAGSTMGVYR